MQQNNTYVGYILVCTSSDSLHCRRLPWTTWVDTVVGEQSAGLRRNVARRAVARMIVARMIVARMAVARMVVARMAVA